MMKKVYIIIISMLLPMLVVGQTLSGTVIAEVDFTSATEFTGWSQFDDTQTDGKVELTSEGLAITVGIQTGQLWQPRVMVLPDGSFNLKEHGNYKVVVKAKFPTNGTLQINMGSWSANDQATFPVTTTGDFQEVVCDFNDWSVDAEYAHLLFQCGDFKGITIVKSIKVYDMASSSSETVLYENDFTGITEFTGWYQFDDTQTDGKVEVNADGVAITVGKQTGQLWQPQVMVVPDGSFNLDKGGNYRVIVTAKFPTSGTLQINMGNWNANDQAQFSVTATGDFQEVVCDFPNWSVDAEDAYLIFRCGDFKGTTILKSIKIVEAGEYKPVVAAALLYENNFTGITEFNGWSQFDDSQTDGKVEVDPDGVAITVGKQTGQLWQPRVMVVPDGSFNLDKDGNYRVVVTAKFPTSGTLQINMGTWSANDQAQFPVTATGDFQEIVCDFPNWSVDAEGAHLLFQCGDFKGTTIVKKIQVIKLDSEIKYSYNTEDKTAEVIQNPNGKYIGAVEIPSKVMHSGVEYSVTGIAQQAFSGCTRLTSITIPNSVTTIGSKAFYECCGLTSITIPNSVTSIEGGAFWDCSGLTSITIPNSVTSIGDVAFRACSSLTSITIPNSVTSIGSGTFFDCARLTSITIPNSVTSIGESAFYCCMGLTSITIPNSVTSIGKGAFSACMGLTYITIPNSVTSIGDYAFDGCSGLTTIVSEIENPFEISEDVFNGSYKDIYATVPLIVPPGKKSAYQNTAGWKKFTNVVEPGQGGEVGCIFETDGIRYKIGENNTVSVVSREAKYSGDVILPGSVEFNGKTYIVTAISDNAFNGCSGLTSVTIPNSVISIGCCAFRFCSALTSVTISNSVTTIGDSAFDGCSGLTSVTIPNSVISIGSSAFERCSGLTSITIPNSVTFIGGEAFCDCSNLSTINFGDNINIIGWAAFNGTAWFNNQPDGLVYIGKIAYKYKGEMPSNTIIIIKEGTITIGAAFGNDYSGLTSITIPNSVKAIIGSAFSGCSGLTTIVSEIENPFAIDESVFSCFKKDIYATATLIVPPGKKSAYQNTAGWKKFQNIVEIVGLGDEFEVNGIRYKIGENNTVSVVSKDAKYSGDISIPTSVSYQKKSYKVTSIGNSAFEGCIDMTSVYLPNSLTNIGNGAFWQCSSLKLVVIPDGVTTIGEGAFHNCFNLVSVVIPNSVTSIGSSAFSNCSNLSQVISRIQNPFAINSNVFTTYSTTTLFIPKGTKSAYSAKSGWKKFTNIDDGTIADPTKRTIHVAAAGTLSYFIPDDEKYLVEELTLSGELNGTDIRYIRDLSGTNYIYYHENNCITFCDEYYAVSTSGKLTVLDITNTKIVSGGDIYYAHTVNYDEDIHIFYFTNNNSITDHMFESCKLEVIKLPDSVTSIESGAFCSSLSSVTIPNSVTSIGSGAFNYTKWYNNHSNGLLYLDQWLIGYKGTAPAGELRIVDGTKGIADGALYWCSGLTSITIPSSVTSIGKYAFSGCSGLTSIISLNSTPPTCQQNSDGSFSQFDSVDKTNCIVWVPRESANAYKEANGWKDFQNIRALILGDVNIDFEANKDDLDALVAYIMDKAPEGFDKDLADLNGDDKVNAADVVKLVTILNIQDGLSTDWQPMFNSSQVITSLACTLNNNWDKAIQVTKCELYYNQSLVGYGTFNVTLASGESKKCSFDSLVDYSAKKGFSVVWHCTYNGDSYTYCFDLPE